MLERMAISGERVGYGSTALGFNMEKQYCAPPLKGKLVRNMGNMGRRRFESAKTRMVCSRILVWCVS